MSVPREAQDLLDPVGEPAGPGGAGPLIDRSTDQPGLTRRAALVTAGAAVVGVGGLAADRQLGSGSTVAESTARSGLTVLDPEAVLHLVRRATFGLTHVLLNDVRKRGPENWLDDQLHPDRIDDPIAAVIDTCYPLLAGTAAQLQAAIPVDDPLRASWQLIEAAIARQVWSRRQLAEVMIDFWSNHFNVTTPMGPTRTTKSVEDRTVIRRHALGRFEDLLVADAKSPAMLVHLGNASSRGDDPNENYGRELLELHTVGINAGYTEDDVRNSAYVLTGWGVGDNGEFRFLPSGHYTGPVEVLGWSAQNASAEHGLAVGEDYLRYLARHEQTARHLSHKLAVRFVSDDPPDSLVDKLAEAYLSADTAIVPWLKTLFSSPEFVASVGQKVRTPLEDLVSSARALGIEPPTGQDTSGIWALIGQSAVLGQRPLGAIPPTGYADVAAAWLSTSGVLGRWNMHRHLTNGGIAGLRRPALRGLLAGEPLETMGALVDRLTIRLTGQVFRDEHRSALLAFLGVAESTPYDDEVVTGSLAELTALVLDSPYHLLR